MVDLSELKRVAEAAARRGLDPTPVVEVRIEDALGQDGEDILRIVIVIPDGRFDDVDGSHLASAVVNVRQDVRNAGDERQAIVEYATPFELTEDDGS